MRSPFAVLFAAATVAASPLGVVAEARAAEPGASGDSPSKAAAPVPALVPSSVPAAAALPVAASTAPSSDVAPAAAAEEAAIPLDQIALPTSRFLPKPPDGGAVHAYVHGEYQLRFQGQSDVPLTPPLSGAPRPASLGQSRFVEHWLRLNPRLDYRDWLSLIAQADVPRGLVGGDTTSYVDASREPRSEAQWYRARLRTLYAEARTAAGTLRLGQQAANWGMGLVANDGDRRSFFGDYVGGSLVERALFATTPLGKGTPLLLVVAGDLVLRDNTADLLGRGDKAMQGVAAAVYREKRGEIGVYGVYRHQSRDRVSTSDITPYTEALDVGVIDVAGKADVDVPGVRAVAYGQFEAAAIVGSTSFVRSAWLGTDPLGAKDAEKVRSYGGAAVLGAAAISGQGDKRYGSLVGEVEYGYASGDANPSDGTTRRFTFDPSHRVGLVLFDHVMRWKTARAATIAQDPRVVDRPPPGADLLASNGGVFGATYVNPRVIYRPCRWADFKAGAVIAQSTADFVDPFHAAALGSLQNYDGGSSRRHDLGLELDAGFEARFASRETLVQLGLEGGVLFPGHAFDDAAGHALPTQALGQVRAGVQF